MHLVITRIDAARICACAEEAENAASKLKEQLDDVLADADEPNGSEVAAHLKGARMKVKAAQTELEHAAEFARTARDVSMGGAR